MRSKKTVVLILALLLLFSFSVFPKTMKLRRVGVCPLLKVKGEIADVEQLKLLVVEYAEHVKTGFGNVDAAFLYEPFMEQVKNGNVEVTEMPKGQLMKWMFFCRGKAIKDLEWAGNKMLGAFALTVQSDCKDYGLIIPKACGNIALVEVKNSRATCDMKVDPAKANIGDTITVDMSGSLCATRMEVKVFHPEETMIDSAELTPGNAQWTTKFNEPGEYFVKGEAFNVDGVASSNTCEAKVYINYPPVCDLKVDPTKGYVGQIFKLDASGSTDKDGKVVKAEFTLFRDGQEFEKKVITSDPLIWNKKIKKSGIYKIYLKVTDDFDAVSANTCELTIEVQKKFYGLVEAGPMVARGTYTGYIFGRLGFAYLLVPERLSVIMSAGGALCLASDPFKSHFLSNLLLNLHFSDFFLGGGIGISSEVKPGWNSDIDIVGNIGVDIFKSFNKKGSIFAELRVPVKKGLVFEHAHEILLGFRFLF